MKIFRVIILILFCIIFNVGSYSQYIVKISVLENSLDKKSNESSETIKDATVIIDNQMIYKTGADGLLVQKLEAGKHTIKVSHQLYNSIDFAVEKASYCLVQLNKKNKRGFSIYSISTDDGDWKVEEFYYPYTNKADSLFDIGKLFYDKYLKTEDDIEANNYYAKAIPYFKQAAELNHEEALLELYEYYNEQNSLDEALQYLNKAADLGNINAIFYLGNYYLNIEDFSKSINFYKKGADLNDERCQRILAEMYEKGLGVEKDVDKALDMYQKASITKNKSNLMSPEQSSMSLPILPSQKRLALIIGNSDYQTGRLVCVGKDIKDMKSKLEELGFETIFCPNVDLMEFLKSISSFCKKAKEGKYDAILFYYAGHGIQCQGENFLIPIGEFYDDDILIKKMYVGMNDVLNETAKTKIKTRIFILDACREQPSSFTRSISKGLVGLGNTPGVFMAYSTMAGKTAKDNGGNGNSPYIKELLKELNVPQRPINDVFENVKRRVSLLTGGKQQPSHVNDLDVSDNEVVYLNRNNH